MHLIKGSEAEFYDILSFYKNDNHELSIIIRKFFNFRFFQSQIKVKFKL